jgi:hypothetical protein
MPVNTHSSVPPITLLSDSTLGMHQRFSLRFSSKKQLPELDVIISWADTKKSFTVDYLTVTKLVILINYEILKSVRSGLLLQLYKLSSIIFHMIKMSRDNNIMLMMYTHYPRRKLVN